MTNRLLDEIVKDGWIPLGSSNEGVIYGRQDERLIYSPQLLQIVKAYAIVANRVIPLQTKYQNGKFKRPDIVEPHNEGST